MTDLIEILKLDRDFPEARTMRAKLDSAGTRAARAQLEELAQKIAVATELGHASTRVDSFEPGVRAALERKGYKVQAYTPDQRDPRDHSYYTVSW